MLVLIAVVARSGLADFINPRESEARNEDLEVVTKSFREEDVDWSCAFRRRTRNLIFEGRQLRRHSRVFYVTARL